jgi:uncharacterized membrane protein YhdT
MDNQRINVLSWFTLLGFACGCIAKFSIVPGIAFYILVAGVLSFTIPNRPKHTRLDRWYNFICFVVSIVGVVLGVVVANSTLFAWPIQAEAPLH